MADFTTRFCELVARSNGSDTGLANALGVSKQTISAWKNGTRFPKKPTIKFIADYFGVGVPWLEGITDDERAMATRKDQADTLSPDENELLSIYRGLNTIGQAALMGAARGLIANPDMKKALESNTETA